MKTLNEHQEGHFSRHALQNRAAVPAKFKFVCVCVCILFNPLHHVSAKRKQLQGENRRKNTGNCFPTVHKRRRVYTSFHQLIFPIFSELIFISCPSRLTSKNLMCTAYNRERREWQREE